MYAVYIYFLANMKNCLPKQARIVREKTKGFIIVHKIVKLKLIFEIFFNFVNKISVIISNDKKKCIVIKEGEKVNNGELIIFIDASFSLNLKIKNAFNLSR